MNIDFQENKKKLLQNLQSFYLVILQEILTSFKRGQKLAIFLIIFYNF